MNNPSSRRMTLWLTLVGIVAVSAGSIVKPSYQIRYNTSHSAPLGWYAVVPVRDVRIGALVLARLPIGAAMLAEERGYLPRTVPVLKRIAATGPHMVCAIDSRITVDGVLAVRTLARDSAGRPLGHWMGCRRLTTNELFLLNTESAASFDSRYFGPIARSDVIGKAIPLWTW
jgi:conjugative transfer signal peptidase TraF